ncbi:hypothetical protein EOS_10425 [Caballeronia mineralivorans PML1(12)]|uniref:Uncharacterized protein n=1 Tax=Caballeronia mineralivorans PML1(12) TaxID=908627 RepID=A0A0J1G211_9BURK|nr:hypothetical protein EOS_10425 [Caballeronia mineralivorans PML1(12)]
MTDLEGLRRLLPVVDGKAAIDQPCPFSVITASHSGRRLLLDQRQHRPTTCRQTRPANDRSPFETRHGANDALTDHIGSKVRIRGMRTRLFETTK